MKGGAFAVDGILREAVEGRQRDQEGRELRVIDELEVKFFLTSTGGDGEIEGDHGGRSAKLTGNGSEMVAGDSPDGPADIDDFRGGERRGERSDHAAARHGERNVAEAEERMTTKIDAVGLDCGNG